MSERILVSVSSKSPIKLRAVERGFARLTMATDVTGNETESGVSGQPRSIEETLAGARNRHAMLQATVSERAGYLVTIESGVVRPFAESPWKGCEVVIVERVVDKLVKVGVDLGIEYPDEMMAKVPSEYPDLGVLLQQEYGFAEKDPPLYLTGGKIARADLIELALFKVLAQMESGIYSLGGESGTGKER